MVTDTQAKTELLTTGEAAELAHIHINTIRRWANAGVIKSFRIGDRGDRRFRKEDVENLLKESVIESTTEQGQV